MSDLSSMPLEVAAEPVLHVFILEPDKTLAAEITHALGDALPGQSAEAAVTIARSLTEAQQLVVRQKPDLFVLDVGDAYHQAQEFICDLRTSHPQARAIVLTASNFNAQRAPVAGLGAIHFLEKPFPRDDFITLVEALFAHPNSAESERFQGTLSDLHISDIIQLKCLGGATSTLEFTGPRGEKARVYFDHGQVRHATTPGKEGLAAFDEVIDWKGGVISEKPLPNDIPQTIHGDWQMLLLDAVRRSDEAREAKTQPQLSIATQLLPRTVLVIDDSLMLLSFVKEILGEKNYHVLAVPTAEEGLRECHISAPDLILLDYVLPDMRGDEVCRKLVADPATSKIPVIYMSGLGSDLQPDRHEIPNVIGALSKPFTSEALVATVEKYLSGERKPAGDLHPAVLPNGTANATAESPAARFSLGTTETCEEKTTATGECSTAPSPRREETAGLTNTSNAYFCGDSGFFSLHWALQTIAREKLTGRLRAFWNEATVDLFSRDGRVVFVTARDAILYCEDSPVTLAHLDRARIDAARAEQSRSGCPIFVTFVNDGLILREPGLELVQHYGQKLFARLWAAERVRFVFELQPPPVFATAIVSPEENIDQWSLNTLRFVLYESLPQKAIIDTNCVPAFTPDGYERVQKLRLTIAEAQLASQFNGTRSLAQIAKNLRLDIKFARLTLFRFTVLEIVDCWPAQLAEKPVARGGLRNFFRR